MTDPVVDSFGGLTRVIDAFIPNGAARTEPLENAGWSSIGVILNGSSWTAADIGVEVSPDRSTWVLLTTISGANLRLTSLPTGAAFARSFSTNAIDVMSFPWFRLISLNTGSAADVNQGAARNLWITLKKRIGG